jgi:hypothetical protein
VVFSVSQAMLQELNGGCAKPSEVLASNLPASELYKKAGLVVEGVQNKTRKHDDTYEDIVCMALLF